MGKQTKASERWAHQTHLAKLDALCAQAKDYTYPAGQAQAGIQLAVIEVPYLLQEIARLKEQINAQHHRTSVA